MTTRAASLRCDAGGSARRAGSSFRAGRGVEVVKREAGDRGITGDRHCGLDWWKEGQEARREMRVLKGKPARREEKDEPRGKAGVAFIA